MIEWITVSSALAAAYGLRCFVVTLKRNEGSAGYEGFVIFLGAEQRKMHAPGEPRPNIPTSAMCVALARSKKWTRVIPVNRFKIWSFFLV
jgi:hypothetical protein